MALGRPSTYTEELGLQICTRLADGESLRAICETEGMPSKSTVLKWVLDGNHKDFTDQYEKARQMQAESMADEIREIADDGHNDWMERQYGDTTAWVENKEAMGRSRLRIDSRKWIASKLLPKKYGDTTKLNLADADGEKLAVSLVINGLSNGG